MKTKGSITFIEIPFCDEIIENTKQFASAHGLETSFATNPTFVAHLTDPIRANTKIRSLQIIGHMEHGGLTFTFIPGFDAIVLNGGEHGFGEIDSPKAPIPTKYILHKPVEAFMTEGAFNPEAFQTVLQQAWDNSIRMARDTKVPLEVETLPSVVRFMLMQRGQTPNPDLSSYPAQPTK